MSDHSIVTEIKKKTKLVETTTKALIAKEISAHEADGVAKLHNSDANTYNAMVKMAVFNAQHHPEKAKPYFNFD